MKNLKKKKEFIDALKLMEDEIIRQAESLSDEHYEPSEKMNNAIENIISDMREKEEKKAYKRKVSIVAVAITVVLVFCLGCTPAVRKTIINAYDKFVEFIAGNNVKTEITELYEPTWLPEGYELKLTQSTPWVNTIIWNNGKNEIIFKQTTSKYASFDVESSGYSKYEIDNTVIYCTHKYDTYHVLWICGDYIFSISCPDVMVADDIEKIIKSIQIKQ